MQISKLGRDLQFEIILVNFTSPPPAEIIIEFFYGWRVLGRGEEGPEGRGGFSKRFQVFRNIEIPFLLLNFAFNTFGLEM